MDDFAERCVPHYQMVYRYALSLARDAHVAEDVTQEAFVRALKGFSGFKGACGVSTWLCQIARNVYFSRIRKEKRTVPMDAQPEFGSDSLEVAFFERERARVMHQALHAMREPYKEVLTLRVFGELEYAEIARLFAKSESWARVTCYRAREMLRESMKEESDG